MAEPTPPVAGVTPPNWAGSLMDYINYQRDRIIALEVQTDYVQPTDPGAVGAGKRWWDTSALQRVGVRNTGNSAWVFFSSPANSIVLDSGSTLGDIHTALGQADEGDTIFLPNETIIHTDDIEINDAYAPGITLAGSGPLSCLQHEGDFQTFNGAKIAFAVHHTHHITIRNFKIKCNRAAVGFNPATRMGGILAGYGLHDLDVVGMTFEGITAIVFNLLRANFNEANYNIWFHDNLLSEFYEQGFEIGAPAYNWACYNNTMITTVDHPQLGSIDPIGIFLGMERPPNGEIVRGSIHHNTVDLRGLATQTFSFGCAFQDGATSESCNWRYSDISVHHNNFLGGRHGVSIQTLRSWGPKGFIDLNNNYYESQNYSINFGAFAGWELKDRINISRERFKFASGITEGWNSADTDFYEIEAHDNAEYQPIVETDFDASDDDNLRLTLPSTPPTDGQAAAFWLAEGTRDVGLRGFGGSPLYRVNTPLMAHPCIDFDGVNDYYQFYNREIKTVELSTSFLTSSGKTILISLYPEAIATGAVQSILTFIGNNFNTAVLSITIRDTAGVRVFRVTHRDNQALPSDFIEKTAALTASQVLLIRHDGTNIYLRVFGAGGAEVGSEVSIASGPSLDLEGIVYMGRDAGGTLFYNGRVGQTKIVNAFLTSTPLTDKLTPFLAKWVP